MRSKVQVYAVIRIDGTIGSMEDAKHRFIITKVLPSFDEAVREVERLNNLNGPKGAFYFWQTTRYYPDSL